MNSTDPINLCSDSELIVLIQNGGVESDKAFTKIDERYRKHLLSYLETFKLQLDENEDIVQEVFIKLAGIISQETYQEKEKLAQLLTKMARNRAIDAIRKKSKFSNISISSWPNFENKFSDSEIMKLTVSETEGESRVTELFSILTKKQKQVFELRINGGFMFREISQETKLPLHSVISRFRNGKNKIRKTLVSLNLTSQDFGYK